MNLSCLRKQHRREKNIALRKGLQFDASIFPSDPGKHFFLKLNNAFSLLIHILWSAVLKVEARVNKTHSCFYCRWITFRKVGPKPFHCFKISPENIYMLFSSNWQLLAFNITPQCWAGVMLRAHMGTFPCSWWCKQNLRSVVCHWAEWVMSISSPAGTTIT